MLVPSLELCSRVSHLFLKLSAVSASRGSARVVRVLCLSSYSRALRSWRRTLRLAFWWRELAGSRTYVIVFRSRRSSSLSIDTGSGGSCWCWYLVCECEDQSGLSTPNIFGGEKDDLRLRRYESCLTRFSLVRRDFLHTREMSTLILHQLLPEHTI